MKLRTNCRYAATAPTHRSVLDQIEDGEIACCRASPRALSRLDDECPPLCRVIGDEVYRFDWMQAFGAHAVVCIARSGGQVMLNRSYYAGRYNDAERAAVMLTIDKWRTLQDALIEANFWSLPPRVLGGGLDGYDLTVEGRRGSFFWVTRMT